MLLMLMVLMVLLMWLLDGGIRGIRRGVYRQRRVQLVGLLIHTRMLREGRNDWRQRRSDLLRWLLLLLLMQGWVACCVCCISEIEQRLCAGGARWWLRRRCGSECRIEGRLLLHALAAKECHLVE